MPATKRKTRYHIHPGRPGFTIGCDPELFILNPDGDPICPAGIIPGTKEEPRKVDYGAVQVDGMAAEFNIDPVTTFSDFDHHIVKVLYQLRHMLPRYHTMHYKPSMKFRKATFDAAPETSKELGCQPDLNAWTGEANPPPSYPSDPYLRTAAGHIHIGWTIDADLADPVHVTNCQDLVKQLDWYLGGWSLSHDKDAKRRRLYGKAGAHRIKPYGVEYRVLSNFWVPHESYRLEVWNRVFAAIDNMRDRFLPETLSAEQNERLIASINNSKIDKALSEEIANPLLTL